MFLLQFFSIISFPVTYNISHKQKKMLIVVQKEHKYRAQEIAMYLPKYQITTIHFKFYWHKQSAYISPDYNNQQTKTIL